MAAQVDEDSAVKAEELKAAANTAFQGAIFCNFVFLLIYWRGAYIGS